MQVSPDDPTSVLWLQQALTKLLLPAIVLVHMAIYDGLTQKAVRNYQQSRGLPVTGDADAATVKMIEDELAAQSLMIS